MPSLILYRVLTPLLLLLIAAPAWGQADLLFSEYVEGSSNNKAIEIYNGTGAPVDLSDYVVQTYFNGSTTAGQTAALSGTLADGGVFVIANTSSVQAILDVADLTSAVATFNGDDAVVLRKGGPTGPVVDVVGQIGFDPGTEWGSGLTSTADNTLRRKAASCSGDADPLDTFDPAVDYDGFAQDTFEGLGAHTADCPVGPPTPTVSFVSPNEQTVTEGTGTFDIDVQIFNAGSEQVTVDVVLTGGTASAADFDSPTTQTVTFPANAPDGTTDTATFSLVDDEDDEGTKTATFELQNVSGGPDATIGNPSTYTLTIEDDDAVIPDLVINEIYADPPTGIEGDANNDGIRGDAFDDEFVEIVNVSEEAVDLSGFTLSDVLASVTLRHTFPEGTVLAANQAIVVFGSGDPQGNFGGALVQVATEGQLGLNNGSDAVMLKDAAGITVDSVGYPGTSGSGNSWTRDPDLDPGDFVRHHLAENSEGRRFSPGTQVDGTPFGGGNEDAIVTVPKGAAGWRMLAPPVAGMTVGDLAAQNLVMGITDEYPSYTSDTTIATYYDGSGFVEPSGKAEVLESGYGFIWYLFDIRYEPANAGLTGGTSESYPLPFTLEALGTEPAADVTVGLHSDGDGWNLLGNPFAEAIDLDQMTVQGGALFSLIGQVWDPDGRSYVLTTSTATNSAAHSLAIWQGAFFENDNAESVTFPTASRIGSGAPFYGRPELVERGRIGFELVGPGWEDGAPATLDRAVVLYLDERAEDGWDPRDAAKLTPLTYPYATLAFVGEREGEEVLKAQEARPFDGGSFEVPLAFEAAGTGGSFALAWPRWENVPEDWAVTLTDAVTGAVVDLRADTLYAFTAGASRPEASESGMPAAVALERSDAPRFTLSVVRASVGTGDGADALAFELGAVHPNPVTGDAAVRYTLPEAAGVRLVVYDVLGRAVASYDAGPVAAGRHTAPLPTAGLASGVYVAHLRAGEASASRRFVVVR